MKNRYKNSSSGYYWKKVGNGMEAVLVVACKGVSLTSNPFKRLSGPHWYFKSTL